MKIIGITGGTGAGKSTVCAELKKRGAKIIDADRISRQVAQRGGVAFDEIVEEFGRDILSNNGEIDRHKLGKVVFANHDKRQRLNAITHKHIYAEMQREIDESCSEIVVLDVPLLFEKNSPIDYDLTVAVVSDEETRLRRIMMRDGIDFDAAKARIRSQMSNEEYARLADVCVENNGNIHDSAILAELILKEVQK